MFTIYHSNQIDILKSLLAELIRSKPLHNPFEKEQVLVQSFGMSQWLKIELAKELGVAANIEFPLPAAFIWNQFVQVLDNVPDRSAFNREAMTWKLMRLLPELLLPEQVLPEQLDKPELAPLSSYLEQDEDDTKLYRLSEKIADIFDTYLVYRPEWITAWEQNREVPELSGEVKIAQWQKTLWQALYQHTLQLGQSPCHRANLYEDFITTLNRQKDFSSLPQRVFVFGISSLPPKYLEALEALGQHIDVHLMFTNPCRYYWGEIRDRKYLAKLAAKNRQHIELRREQHSVSLQPKGETEQLKEPIDFYLNDGLHTDVVGNSLLASMGKLGRDNMYLLSQLASNEIDAFVDIKRDSLLHQLQADILNLEERQDDDAFLSSSHKYPLQTSDRSLTLHACHSPMREVEVLHDRLLEMFDDTPDLKPRNVIVMVADINAYSPAIQAVFGNASGSRFIPYSISDRSAVQENPILTAFLSLITLPQSRYTASEIFELLETPEILKKFAITAADFEKGKLWVEEAGIRWGLDNHTGQEFDLPETNQNTWLFGMQRMLLGYAMHESTAVYQFGEYYIAPYDQVQGIEAELAGNLAQFIEKLTVYREQLKQPQSITQWQTLLYQLIDDFFEVDIEGEVALKLIRDTLSQLTESLTEAAFDRVVTLNVLTEYLQDALSGSKVSQRFLAGQVNFCTLMPMRSVPFEVVCLLGMNDGVYPRSTIPDGLDLMNGRARQGDRSRRDDDRYLFLEALLSAQSKLYISYVSRSIQDNSERVPSILVSELLEYCGHNYCLQGDQDKTSDESSALLRDHLTIQYPMAPFSERAFSDEYQSYADEWIAAANRNGQTAESFIQPLSDYRQSAQQSGELALSELQRFWRLPVQYFFNRRLKVFFEEFKASIEDNEPFVLDKLQSYHLRDELLHSLLTSRLNDQNESDVYQHITEKQKAKGELPIGAFGQIDLMENREKTEALVEKLTQLCLSPLEDIEVNFQLSGDSSPIVITGWLKSYFQAGLVRYRSGKIRSQDLLTAWIDHLCAIIAGHKVTTHLVGFDTKSGIEHKQLLPIDKTQANKCLTELVQFYYHGLNEPLPYFPKTVLVGTERRLAGKEDDEDKMLAVFHDSYQFRGEGSNPYINRVWPVWNQILYKEVSRLGDDIMAVILQQLKEAKA